MEPLSDQAVMTPAPERPLHLQQTDQNGARFDVTGRYYVKPNFLRVLRMVEGVDQTKVVFEYKEVSGLDKSHQCTYLYETSFRSQNT